MFRCHSSGASITAIHCNTAKKRRSNYAQLIGACNWLTNANGRSAIDGHATDGYDDSDAA